ncbi:MAG TPA: amidohydrolase family protein [Allosphingosinicella sp.]
MRFPIGAALLSLASAALAAAQPGTAPPSRPSAAPARIPAPAVDHHLHLLTPEAAAILVPPLLPPVALPQELASLLRARTEQPSRDLYTRDAIILDIRGPTWVRGRAAIQAFLGGAQRGSRLVPVSYSLVGQGAHVAGLIVRGEGEAARPVRTFHLSLTKEGAGWLIAAESWSERAPPTPRATFAQQLVAEMDAAGVRRGVVHSPGYFFASPLLPKPYPREAALVSAQNDWIVRQVAQYPGRLVAFCGVNPLKDHALAEISRCGRIEQVRGIKLHLGNSGVDLRNRDHVERLAGVFRAADAAKLAIAIHLWNGPRYGSADAAIFLADILPMAPDVAVQVMHLAGGGGAYGPDEALTPFAAAIAAGSPQARNLYFDVAAIVTGRETPEQLALIARRIRELGVRRILFGTDRDGLNAMPPAEAWAAFSRLPLDEAEFRTIAANAAPYLD